MPSLALDELDATLGQRLKSLRLAKNLDQIAPAQRAAIGVSALKNLENGRGFTLHSLVSVVRALADALPDDFGNALINRYMAAKGAPAAAVPPLHRLAYMGHRAMGGLAFKPVRGPATHKPMAIEWAIWWRKPAKPLPATSVTTTTPALRASPCRPADC